MYINIFLKTLEDLNMLNFEQLGRSVESVLVGSGYMAIKGSMDHDHKLTLLCLKHCMPNITLYVWRSWCVGPRSEERHTHHLFSKVGFLLKWNLFFWRFQQASSLALKKKIYRICFIMHGNSKKEILSNVVTKFHLP